jgi:prepilin peptidase CpaA
LIHLPIALQAALALIVILAAVLDLRSRRVPNWLVLSGLLLGIGTNAALSGIPGLWIALKGLGLAFLIYFPLYLLRGIGAGDVKLAAAVGAIAGPGTWFSIFIYTLIFRGIAAVVLILARRRLGTTSQNIRLILTRLGSGKVPYAGNPQLDVRRAESFRMPHAVAMALGTLTFLMVSAIRASR